MHAPGTYEFWNELLQGEVESPTIRFAGRTARYGWKQNAETIEVGTVGLPHDMSALLCCCSTRHESSVGAHRLFPRRAKHHPSWCRMFSYCTKYMRWFNLCCSCHPVPPLDEDFCHAVSLAGPKLTTALFADLPWRPYY